MASPNLWAIERVDTTLLLSEISVMAAKTGDRPQSQPVSYTLLGTKELASLNITNLKQASDIVPNFYMPAYGSKITSSIYLRGFGSRIDQPAVTLMFDNIPILNKNNFDFDIVFLNNLEVLRGPQATLIGRNSLVGAINLTTLSPIDFQGVKAHATYGSYNTWQAAAGWWGKTSQRLHLSFDVQAGGTSGYWNNAYNNSRIGKELGVSLRSRLNYQAENGLVLDNSLTIGFARQNGYPYEWLDTEQISYNDTCFYKRLSLLEGLTLSYPIASDVIMTSVTSLQYLDDNMTLDQDFLPLDYFTLTQKTRETGLTQEVMFRNTSSSNAYHWITGAMGWMRHGTMNAPVRFKDYGIKELIEKHRNEQNPHYPIQWNDRQFLIGTDFNMNYWGASVYHESKYSWNRFMFSAGLRIDFERNVLDYRSLLNTSYTVYDAATGEKYLDGKVDIDENGRLTQNFWEFLPKFSITYFTDAQLNNNLYFNIAKGYKSGGYNTQMFSDVMQQRLRQSLGLTMQYNVEEIVSYRPEKAWNFELGTHLSFLANTLKLDASLFYITCRDQQVTMFPSGTTTGRIMANAGRSRSFGFEVSATASINSHWTLNGSFGYTNARFIDFADGINDYSGCYIPYAPLTTSFLQGIYSTQLPSSALWFDKLQISLSAKGTGPIYWNETNTRRQNWYPLVNAMLSLQKSHFTAEAWFENITATHYSTFYFLSMSHEFAQRGAPFRCGLNLKVSF